MDSKPGQSKMTDQKKPSGNPPYQWCRLHERTTRSLSPPKWVYARHSFLLVSTLLFSLLSVPLWKFISAQLIGQDLVTGPGGPVLSWLQPAFKLWLGNQNLISSRCRPPGNTSPMPSLDASPDCGNDAWAPSPWASTWQSWLPPNFSFLPQRLEFDAEFPS